MNSNNYLLTLNNKDFDIARYMTFKLLHIMSLKDSFSNRGNMFCFRYTL